MILCNLRRRLSIFCLLALAKAHEKLVSRLQQRVSWPLPLGSCYDRTYSVWAGVIAKVYRSTGLATLRMEMECVYHLLDVEISDGGAHFDLVVICIYRFEKKCLYSTLQRLAQWKIPSMRTLTDKIITHDIVNPLYIGNTCCWRDKEVSEAIAFEHLQWPLCTYQDRETRSRRFSPTEVTSLGLVATVVWFEALTTRPSICMISRSDSEYSTEVFQKVKTPLMATIWTAKDSFMRDISKMADEWRWMWWMSVWMICHHIMSILLIQAIHSHTLPYKYYYASFRCLF